MVLKGYGLGTKQSRILRRFCHTRQWYQRWDGTDVDRSRQVDTRWHSTPTIFTIIVDAVIRAVLLQVFVPQESQHGIGWDMVKKSIFFYADYVQIADRNPIWVQKTLMALVCMFERVAYRQNQGRKIRRYAPPDSSGDRYVRWRKNCGQQERKPYSGRGRVQGQFVRIVELKWRNYQSGTSWRESTGIS